MRLGYLEGQGHRAELPLKVPLGWLEQHVKKLCFLRLPSLLLIHFQQDVSATCLFLET